MCRMLVITAPEPVDCAPFLSAFARQCQASREYQGHGFGVAWRENDAWSSRHDLTPIWEAALPVPPATTLLIAHARSAFRDEGIVVEHNMPFIGPDGLVFAFNGEVRGVRVRAPGANGAWRLFHLLDQIRKPAPQDVLSAIRRLDTMIHERSEYVRALNLIVSDGQRTWINNRFGEDPGYFTMHTACGAAPDGTPVTVAASEPFPSGVTALAWSPVSAPEAFELGQPIECFS